MDFWNVLTFSSALLKSERFSWSNSSSLRQLLIFYSLSPSRAKNGGSYYTSVLLRIAITLNVVLERVCQPWASSLMGTPPRQKSSRVESSIESGKLLKMSSRVLNFWVPLSSILLVFLARFRVEYSKQNSETRWKLILLEKREYQVHLFLTYEYFKTPRKNRVSSTALLKKLAHGWCAPKFFWEFNDSYHWKVLHEHNGWVEWNMPQKQKLLWTNPIAPICRVLQ